MTGIEETLRDLLRPLTEPAGIALQLLIVADQSSASPTVSEIPISVEFADQLKHQCAETAGAASSSELRAHDPGFRAAAHQWTYVATGAGPIAQLDEHLRSNPPARYDRGTQFGRKNVLVFKLLDEQGADIGRMYQGFSEEKALQRKKFIGWWSGERFESADAEPLIIDRALRLIVVGGWAVMQSSAAYESLFGALPDLRQQAERTFVATLGKLDIMGGDELLESCRSDINMMRKLMSVKHKLDQPGYVASIEMPPLIEFLHRNPHIDVQIDSSGPKPRLVHSTNPQRRWALLKLLDDDYLRSDLTNINYEANSKTEISG